MECKPSATTSTVTSVKRIGLTLAHSVTGQPSQAFNIGVAELIAYAEHTGYTRLNLVGGRVLDVKETVGQIDQLVRHAAQSLQ